MLHPFQPLLALTTGFIPGFTEVAVNRPSDFICTPQNNQVQLETLYNQLASQHPEAGAAYWRTRLWSLVCWQPLSIAFLAIYGLQWLPAKLGQIKQYCQLSKGEILGFAFADTTQITGSTTTLIPQAASQLRPMFQHLLTDINLFCTLQIHNAERLLADQVIELLVLLANHQQQVTPAQAMVEIEHWLTALQLPEQALNNLTCDDSRQLQFIRRTCCLDFRRHNGKLCDNCPKVPRPAHRPHSRV